MSRRNGDEKSSHLVRIPHSNLASIFLPHETPNYLFPQSGRSGWHLLHYSGFRGGITYTSGAASGSKYTIRTSLGDKPVNYVSWYDSARFTNVANKQVDAGLSITRVLRSPAALVSRPLGQIRILCSRRVRG